MLIPSIDLMGGKIVQLVQGEKKALEFDNFDYWIEQFSKYPLVQVIDLDAARGKGNNGLLVKQIVGRLNCQVGGGIRSLEDARKILDAGARRVILGSVLLKDGKINTQCAAALASAFGAAPLVFALDSRSGRIAIDGWRKETAVTAFDMIRRHDPGARTILRNLSLHAHRYGRIDVRNSDGNCGRNPASYFEAANGRWGSHDATRNRQPPCAGDGRRCGDGLVFRQDFGVKEHKHSHISITPGRTTGRFLLCLKFAEPGLLNLSP
jgi:hypothetical protein